jgi:endoglucanase
MRTIMAFLTMTGFLIHIAAVYPAGPPLLKVEGKQLKTPDGKAVRLRGVNIPSLEWGQGEHVFDSLRVAIDDWGVNLIRLPLAQDRWFGHTWEKKDEGKSYRETVRDFVRRAAAKRCYVILDLHWSNAGRWGQHIGQHQMPDDNSVAFWQDVAAAFANHSAVLFGLYNEPYGVSWPIWRDGGTVVEEDKKAGRKWEYHTPGLQKLLDVCRAAGAKNIVLAGGLDWGYDLSGVVQGHALHDPKGNGVVYDTHIYPWKKDWDRWVTPTVKKYAVFVGEFGPDYDLDKKDPKKFLSEILSYLDKYELSWTAWCMHPGAKPCLIKDWKYTLTPFGEPVVKALRAGVRR